MEMLSDILVFLKDQVLKHLSYLVLLPAWATFYLKKIPLLLLKAPSKPL